VQLLVVNGAGVRAGVGEVGEIAIRSPHIALGYIGEEGAHRFMTTPSGDTMYRTGDLGRYEPSGVVRIAGRADGQVKIRGFRVETGEVAAVLRAHSSVRDAVVVARDVGALGRALVAYVVPVGDVPAHSALLAALRERLPDYMIPSVFVALDAIPLTPNGKLDRKALPDPDVPQSSGEVALPENDLEAALLMLWRGALKRPAVGVTDSFFDAGGHSLLATQLVAKVGQVFRQTVPLRLLFESPRVRDFARALAAREAKPGITAQIARLVVKIDAQRTETSPARDERVGVTS
jgi:hypothetical protein